MRLPYLIMVPLNPLPLSDIKNYGSVQEIIHTEKRSSYSEEFCIVKMIVILFGLLFIALIPLSDNNSGRMKMSFSEKFVHSETIVNALSEIALYTDRVQERILSTFKDGINSKKLSRMWENTYPFTAKHSWRIFPDDNTVFVSTGDISQMWLRDSSVQMSTYLPQIAKQSPDSALRKIFEAVLRRQIRFIKTDPYASAFYFQEKKAPNSCQPTCGNFTFQHDFELDSLLFPCWLHHEYWKITGATDHLTVEFFDIWEKQILPLLRTEQYHNLKSSYFYKPEKNPVKDGVGLVWSFARPSDDQTEYGYNIPQNIFAVVVLTQLSEMAKFKGREKLAQEAKWLAIDIDFAIEHHGVFPSPINGEPMYGFEVDGFGNKTLQDDANMPNLLWIPYIGYNKSFRQELHGDASKKDYYRNTRDFSLSKSNPNFFSGLFSGLGSQHTSHGLRPITHGPQCDHHCVWPLGLIMSGFTSLSEIESVRDMQTVLETDDGQDLLHEGFDVNDASLYNRDWFGWANGLFSLWVLDIYS